MENNKYKDVNEQILKNKEDRKEFFIGILIIVGFILFVYGGCFWDGPDRGLLEKNDNTKYRTQEKSTWEQNMDLAREIDRMEKAQLLDQIEEERKEINKYRKYKD